MSVKGGCQKKPFFLAAPLRQNYNVLYFYIVKTTTLNKQALPQFPSDIEDKYFIKFVKLLHFCVDIGKTVGWACFQKLKRDGIECRMEWEKAVSVGWAETH